MARPWCPKTRKSLTQQNPIFDDNVNVSKTHPLVDLLWLAGGAVLIIVSLTVLLYLCMQWLAPHIPFSYEEKLIANVGLTNATEVNTEIKPQHQKRLAYLQKLSNGLAKAQALDKNITIKVHWMEDDMINAFATLGGHIFITKGLWEAMPNENALAMVIAHEIAHVKHRDPLRNLGASASLSLISAMIFGSSDAGMSLIGSSGLITSLHFTRDMESEADKAAIEALFNHYGHVAGATQFFDDILDQEDFNVQFLQTHPLTQNRIDQLLALQKESGWPKKQNQLIDLPRLENLD